MRWTGSCWGICLLGGPLMAQQPADTVRLKPVVVTADRLPRDPQRVTSSVVTLSDSELTAQGTRDLATALRTVPGMAVVESGSFGSQTSSFFRGGESDYTKVLLNGVPLNQPGGAFNFAGWTIDNVDRIEVARGPGSVLYGTDAMTGVVQLITRDRPAVGGLDGRVGWTGGTFGTSDWSADLAAGRAGAGVSLAASRFLTAGTLPYNNESDHTVVDARAHLAREGTGDASLSVRWMEQTYHFPTDGAGSLVDRNQYNTERGPALALDAGHPFSQVLEARLLLTERHDDTRYDNEPDNAADTLGVYLVRTAAATVRRAADLRVNVRTSPTATFTVGGMLEYESYDATNLCQSQYGDCSTPELQARRDTRALYAQEVADWARLSVSLGARLDDNTRFGRIATYRLGALYRIGAATRLRVQGGTGFKEPTFIENFDYEPSSYGTVRGNSNLQGERSQSWEAGIEQGLWAGRMNVGVTWFDQRFRDMVDFTFAPADTSGPNYFNVAAATAQGLELMVRVPRLAPTGLAATIGYTYLHTAVTTPGLDPDPGAAFAAGQPLLRRPAHSGTVTLDYAISSRVGVAGTAYFVGRRWDQDYAVYPFPRVELPGYARIDLAGQWRLLGPHPGANGGGVSLFLRVRNLLDAQYEEVRHFAAPGRALFIGTEVRFGS